LDQAQAIQTLLDVYNTTIGSSYVVTRHPDLENRDAADIDAYAESDGLLPLAIEHTKIQSLEYQNRSSAWFMRALGPLELELTGMFPFQLDVVFAYSNLEAGQDWTRIYNAIKAWLVANAQGLALGDTTHHLPDVPFRLRLRKRASSDPRVSLVREVPSGNADLLLLREMQKSLDHKYAKLGEYQAQGAVSVLLLESEDVALVSPQDLYVSFLRSTLERPRPNLDQVWLSFSCSVYSCWLLSSSTQPEVCHAALR
jgi:hypothetical protein